MINPLLYILKIYLLMLSLPGVIILTRPDRHYILGFLLGSFLVLCDILLLLISFRRYKLTYSKSIVYMLIRILLLGLVILLMSIYGIINRLNIIGVIIALLLYPLALIIGGVRILRWKK